MIGAALAGFLGTLIGRGDFVEPRRADFLGGVDLTGTAIFDDRVERRVDSIGVVDFAFVAASPLVSGEDFAVERRASLEVAAFFAGGAESSFESALRFCDSTEERSLVEALEVRLTGAEGLADAMERRGGNSGNGSDLARSEGLRADEEVMLAAARRIASLSAVLRGVGAILTRPMMAAVRGDGGRKCKG